MPYSTITILLSFAAILVYLNHRFFKINSSIFILAASLCLALFILVAANMGWQLAVIFKIWIGQLDFYNILINGMLGFLLFAGALSIDVNILKEQAWEISLLSLISTIISTVLMGTLCYYLLRLFNLSFNFFDCLLFGALISPTDPIAVLAIFKKMQVAKKIQIAVASESLFNDGIAVVLFVTLYHLAFTQQSITVLAITHLFLQQALGGVIAGSITGILGRWLIARNEDLTANILLTLALVSAGYSLAQLLNVSGLLAMVVAGIIIGNSGFSREKFIKRQQIIHFWEILEDILNAILFLLMGIEVINIHFSWQYSLIGVISFFILLLVRYISVAIPMGLLKFWRNHLPYTITVLTWGGLRGGLALALALALPAGSMRELFLVMTYIIVIFSILVQGTFANKLARLVENK